MLITTINHFKSFLIYIKKLKNRDKMKGNGYKSRNLELALNLLLKL